MNEFTIRNIIPADYTNNYLQLLQQYFSITPIAISHIDFTNYVNNLHDYHQIFVITTPSHYTTDNKNIQDNIQIYTSNIETIIGSITILIENKLIHNFGKVAHIEDVIVHNEFRGKGIGKMLIEKCIEVAKQNGCYKIILDCSEHNCEFYEKCGFTQKGTQMAMYF